MMNSSQHPRVRHVLAAVAALAVPAIAAAQGWKSPVGNAYATWVSSGSPVAAVTLPDGGGVMRAEQASVSGGGLAATNATAVTSGDQTADLIGVQSVASASSVSILGGRITATSVSAIATVTGGDANGDGSGATGLVIDGVSYPDDGVAPNTRVDLPGVGYVVLNERSSVKGKGRNLTVQMIHVYLVDPVTGTKTGDIVVASATSADTR